MIHDTQACLTIERPIGGCPILLAAEGIGVTVIDMHTIKPLDEACVIEHCAGARIVVTAEDHQVNGGLGSAVAEVLVENHPIPMKRVGMRDSFAESGPYLEIVKKYGMSAEHIAAAVEEVVARKGSSL